MFLSVTPFLGFALAGITAFSSAPVVDKLSAADEVVLRKYAADTWRSVAAMVGPNGLPADGLHREHGGPWVAAGATSPTDVAAYLWSVPAAQSLGLVGPAEAGVRIGRTLATLEGMKRSGGFFYNWYDPVSGEPLAVWPGDGRPLRPFLSSVDNAWLAAALMIVGRARPELADRAAALLRGMDFSAFYDPFNAADPAHHAGLFRIGRWADTGEETSAHYGLLNTEARIISYVAISLGQVPAEQYFRMQRALPPEQSWQQQVPAGGVEDELGVRVFEGHYTVGDLQVVPSWGGSMFEALMVSLFVPEDEWGPTSWGVNHPLYVRAQVEFGRSRVDHGLWGFSPSSRPGGGYGEYGVPALGSRPGGYPAGESGSAGDRHAAGFVVTPHASFLALPFAPRLALANLAELAARFPVYDEFGFLDAVNVTTGDVAGSVLVLDQGMVLASISNAVGGGALRRLFASEGVERAVRPLLASEHFSAGVKAAPAAVPELPLSPFSSSATGAVDDLFVSLVSGR